MKTQPCASFVEGYRKCGKPSVRTLFAVETHGVERMVTKHCYGPICKSCMEKKIKNAPSNIVFKKSAFHFLNREKVWRPFRRLVDLGQLNDEDMFSDYKTDCWWYSTTTIQKLFRIFMWVVSVNRIPRFIRRKFGMPAYGQSDFESDIDSIPSVPLHLVNPKVVFPKLDRKK